MCGRVSIHSHGFAIFLTACEVLLCFMKPGHAAFAAAEVDAFARAGGSGSGGGSMVRTLESLLPDGEQ